MLVLASMLFGVARVEHVRRKIGFQERSHHVLRLWAEVDFARVTGVLRLVMGRAVDPQLASCVDVATSHDADLSRSHAGEQL